VEEEGALGWGRRRVEAGYSEGEGGVDLVITRGREESGRVGLGIHTHTHTQHTTHTHTHTQDTDTQGRLCVYLFGEPDMGCGRTGYGMCGGLGMNKGRGGVMW
jgi:hypothetical protein